MKYVFLINKLAGAGKYKKILPNIEKEFEGKDYDVRYISKEKTSDEIIDDYSDGGNIIFVLGGDGTITSVLSAIIKTNNKLGIIPVGSGNDTYKAIKNLPKGDTLIDLAKINDTYFINVACTGLDAEVGNNAEKFKNTIVPNSQIYNASIIYTFFNYRFKKVLFKNDIKNISSKYSIISICNGAFYGGGYNIAPKSELTDGLLDVYFVEKMNRFKILPLLLKVKKGEHEGKKRIHKYRLKHVELNLEEDITFNVDGEQITDKNFVIDILPKKITIYNDNELIEKIMNV